MTTPGARDASRDRSDEAPITPRSTGAGAAIVRADVIGTVALAAALAVAVPLRDERPGQVTIVMVAMGLFAIGVATTLWAYTSALERSRVHEVGVANLFLLTGATAPPRVRRTMWACLAAQVVLAIGGAAVGASGLDDGELNPLAFGVLVPMFGLGMHGIWAVRYGTFGGRVDRSERPTNRKIG